MYCRLKPNGETSELFNKVQLNSDELMRFEEVYDNEITMLDRYSPYFKEDGEPIAYKVYKTDKVYYEKAEYINTLNNIVFMRDTEVGDVDNVVMQGSEDNQQVKSFTTNKQIGVGFDRILFSLSKPLVEETLAILKDTGNITHDSSYIMENGKIKTNPLTNAPLRHHKYHKEVGGTTKEIKYSMSSYVNFNKPFKKWQSILDVGNTKRWKAYLSDEVLAILNDKKVFGELIEVNTEFEFEGNDRYNNSIVKPHWITVKITDAARTYVKAALNNDETLLQPVLAKLSEDDKYKVLAMFNGTDRVRNSDGSYSTTINPLKQNTVAKLKGIEYGALAGTAIHSLTQAYLLLLKDYVLQSGYTTEIKDLTDLNYFLNQSIDPAQEEQVEALEWLKKVLSTDIKKREFLKALQDYDEFIRTGKAFTNSKMMVLVKPLYVMQQMLERTKVANGNNYPAVLVENVLYSEKNRIPRYDTDIVTKADITLVYDNGKTIFVDIKTSATDRVRAANYDFNTDSINNRFNKEVTNSKDKYPIEMGYRRNDQTKHSLQLEMERKIAIEKGIPAGKIETYILPFVVEDIDKITPLLRGESDMEVFDNINRIEPVVFGKYRTELGNFFISGEDLLGRKENRSQIDRQIGNYTVEEVARKNEEAEFQERLKNLKDKKLDINAYKKKLIAGIEEKISIQRETIVRLTPNKDSDDVKREITELENRIEKDLNSINLINNNIDDVVAVVDYIKYTYSQMSFSDEFGSYRNAFLNVVEHYNDGKIKLENTLQELQDIYNVIQSFKPIYEVKYLIDSGLPIDEESKDKVNDIIRDMTLIDGEYLSVARKMLAKRLYQFHNKQIDNYASDKFSVDLKKLVRNQKATEAEVIQLRAKLEEGIPIKESDITVEGRVNLDLFNVYFNNKQFIITEQSIENELHTLEFDITQFSGLILGGGVQNEKTLQLFFKLFKSTLIDAERKTQEQIIELDRALQSFNSKGVSNSPKKHYGEILEEIEYYTEKDGKNEKVKAVSFINEFDFNYKLKEDELVQALQNAFLLNKKRDIDKAKKELELWRKENLHSKYNLPDIEPLLIDDARTLLDKIEEERYEIYAKEGFNQDMMRDEDKEALKALDIKEAQLANLFDEKGKKKKGKALNIANSIKQYKEAKANLYDYEKDEVRFKKDFEEMMLKYKNSSEEEKRLIKNQWYRDNTVIVPTAKLFDKKIATSLLISYVKVLDIIQNQTGQVSDTTKLKGFISRIGEEGELINEIRDELNKLKRTNYTEIQDELTFSSLYTEVYELIKPYGTDLPVDIAVLVKSKLEQIENIKKTNIQTLDAIKQGNNDLALINIGYVFNNEELKSINQSLNTSKAEYSKQVFKAEYVEKIKQLKAKYGTDGVEEGDVLEYLNDAWFKANHYVVEFENGHKQTKALPQWYEEVLDESELFDTFQEYGYGYKKSSRKAIIEELDNEIKRIAEEYGVPNNIFDIVDKLKEENKTVELEFINDNFTIVGVEYVYREERIRAKILLENDYEIQYSPKYSSRKIKERYLKSKEELEKITFPDGSMKPLDKWVNPKFIELKKNERAYSFYKYITELYLKQQESYPKYKRKGLIIPSRLVNKTEALLNGDGKIALQRLKDNFVSSKEDEERYGVENSKLTPPILFTQYMSPQEVSYDIAASMQSFILATNKYKALTSITNEINMMSNIFEDRESNHRVLQKDSKGKILMKKLKKLDKTRDEIVDRYATKTESSNSYIFFKSFIDLQFKGIQNTPVEVFGVRIDKVFDNLAKIGSYTTIGGITPIGLTKGLVNGLQAELSLKIESFGGEFFDGSDVRESRKSILTNGLVKDLMSDLEHSRKGGIANTSITGQIADYYDPMQGNFQDQLGGSITGTTARKLFRANTWFLNQYAGEYINSMTLLFTMMNTYKIQPDGSVLTWTEYKQIQKEKGNDINKLSKVDYSNAKAAFRKLPALHTAFEIVNGKLAIKKGVQWDLKSKEDKELRMKVQAISRELNGAYANLDKAKLQVHFLGRALFMYKKYLMPTVQRRFRDAYGSEEIGAIREGYYRTYYSLIGSGLKDSYLRMRGTDAQKAYLNGTVSELRKLAKLHKQIVSGGRIGGLSEQNEDYTPAQLAAVRKALIEHILVIGMLLLLRLIDIDDDEDIDDATAPRLLLIYLLKRLTKEQTAVMLNPFVGNPIDANYKLLSSPMALTITIDAILDVFQNLFDLLTGYTGFSDIEDTRYKANSGLNEKGDLKITNSIRKLFGSLNINPNNPLGHTTLEQMIQNLDRKD